ncbi:Aminopeptidase N [Flavobacterium longum]|uniref:M1 family aminopeptidase/hydrolase n=1 Tax=Flavobacterium longum TaxID=1299340 RepID=UPI0039ECC29F
MKKTFVLLLAVLVLTACKKETAETTEHAAVKDEHSYAEPDKAVVTHLSLDINVDFNTETISGCAIWTIDNKSKGNEIVFDENALEIEKVTLDDNQPTTFSLGDKVEYHGRAVRVKIKPDTKKVSVYYRTTKDGVALQWLKPAQTADKKYPFVFSQGESVWTRTWLPCQDSPSIKFTYDAKVTVPKELLAMMSADNPQVKNDTGVYTFEQKKPISSYLLAIAVGDVGFKAIDGRTGVYAEHSVLDKAAWEFGELGKMVNAAEKLFGPYRWGRYDVLVLPPSFPYGGMENPNLTFLTPGVIAGDRSLTSLLAHELGHSWSGNLVTNATWDDVWLNEGFTTYVEHRIGEAVFGVREAKMQDVMSRKVLTDNLSDYGSGHEDTRLKVSTHGRNPDDSLSDIPYEKGYAFLQAVELAVGRETFDKFITQYFNDHAFQSITTEEFLAYFNEHLIKGDKALADKIKAEDWIYKPDVPANIPVVTSEDFKRIDAIQVSWRKTGVTGLAAQIKSTNERQHFIDYLPEDLTAAEMAALDNEFKFTEKGNFVIRRQWFAIAIRQQYKPAYPAIEQFMVATSRTGSLTTLYREMTKTPEGKTWARRIFDKAKSGYHATTVEAIGNVLK